MEFLEKLYSKIWSSILRPPREKYRRSDLGPSHFTINNIEYKRKDIKLRNQRDKALECSLYKEQAINTSTAVVVCLHGNSSSRLSAIPIIKSVLPLIDVFTFDFSGSGISQGQFVSLGHHQKQDIHTVVTFLKNQYKYTTVILWGRSMGAVASIIYQSKYKQATALILDSPFSDIEQLMYEIADQRVTLPNFIINIFIEKILTEVKQKMLQHENYQFDLLSVKPIQYIQDISIPTLFIAGEQDKLVNHQHSKLLYQKCPSKLKSIEIFEGGHNGNRSPEVKYKILNFIRDVIGKQEKENKPILQDVDPVDKIPFKDTNTQFENLLETSNKIFEHNEKWLNEINKVGNQRPRRRNRIFSRSQRNDIL